MLGTIFMVVLVVGVHFLAILTGVFFSAMWDLSVFWTAFTVFLCQGLFEIAQRGLKS